MDYLSEDLREGSLAHAALFPNLLPAGLVTQLQRQQLALGEVDSAMTDLIAYLTQVSPWVVRPTPLGPARTQAECLSAMEWTTFKDVAGSLP